MSNTIYNKSQRLTTRGYPLGFFSTIRERKSIIQGLDEVIHGAIQATMPNKSSKKLIKVSVNNGNYEVLDNGVGMKEKQIEAAYSNFKSHSWEENNNSFGNIGIKGIGRFIFAAICGDFETGGCIFEIKSSTGDKEYTELTLALTKNEDDLIHPTIKSFPNEGLEDNGININNGKLKGTIVSIKGGLKYSITDKDKLEYGMRFRKFLDKKFLEKEFHQDIEPISLTINGDCISPIDVTHDMLLSVSDSEDGFHKTVDENGCHFVSVVKTIEYYHKNNKNDKNSVKVLCTCPLSSDELKITNKWENGYGFNELGGVFVDYNGCLITLGNNAQSMFHQDIITGNTRGKGEYGDNAGSYSAYNRMTILLNESHAALFGISSAKSTGIDPLIGNKDLTNKYYVLDSETGNEVSLYDYIAHIRKLLHTFYTRGIKKFITGSDAKRKWENGLPTEKQYENATDKIIEWYKDYNFFTGQQKTKGVRKPKDDSSDLGSKTFEFTKKQDLYVLGYYKIFADNTYEYEIELDRENKLVKRYLENSTDRDYAASVLLKWFKDYLNVALNAKFDYGHIVALLHSKGQLLSNHIAK